MCFTVIYFEFPDWWGIFIRGAEVSGAASTEPDFPPILTVLL